MRLKIAVSFLAFILIGASEGWAGMIENFVQNDQVGVYTRFNVNNETGLLNGEFGMTLLTADGANEAFRFPFPGLNLDSISFTENPHQVEYNQESSLLTLTGNLSGIWNATSVIVTIFPNSSL